MTEFVKFCSGGDCPEIRYVGGRVEIRDSARPAEVAWFRTASWEAFVADVKAGKFDGSQTSPEIAHTVPDPRRTKKRPLGRHRPLQPRE